MKKFRKSINSNLKTTVYTPTTLPCYQPRTSSPNFTNNPMKYIFGGTDYQHYFNEKYEYSGLYPTEDHARAIKNAKLVTPQNIKTLNIMANLYESQTRTFIFTPTTI